MSLAKIKALSKIRSFFSCIGRVVLGAQRTILAVLNVVIAMAMCLEVILRFANVPLLSLEDFVMYVVVWLYFIGVSYGAYRGTHYRGEMVTLFIRNAKILELLRGLFGFISTGLMIYLSYLAIKYIQWAIEIGERSSTLGISSAFAIAAFVVGFTLGAWYFLVEAIEHLRTSRRSRAELEEFHKQEMFRKLQEAGL